MVFDKIGLIPGVISTSLEALNQQNQNIPILRLIDT